ncbi:MAG: hypothetical protein KA603_03175 [Azonexus sp.]|nr:hypothetical protein [Betaproteobacteria bacterium]MBP6035119.1 hypothetical protein [Azonexus sp.]MBP6905903.1 hypothetical protein [Azonexus sp.]
MTSTRKISMTAAVLAGVALPLWLVWRARVRRAKAVQTSAALQGDGVKVAGAGKAKAPAPVRAAPSPQPSAAAGTSNEATDPLSRARVFASFGHRVQAEAVLEGAVAAGELNREEVALFWARHEVESARRAAAPLAAKVRKARPKTEAVATKAGGKTQES